MGTENEGQVAPPPAYTETVNPPPQGYLPQGYPPQTYPPQGYPPQQPGYPPQQPGYPPQQPGYPPQQPGYPPQQYPPQQYPPQQGYPGQYPIQQYPAQNVVIANPGGGYPNQMPPVIVAAVPAMSNCMGCNLENGLYNQGYRGRYGGGYGHQQNACSPGTQRGCRICNLCYIVVAIVIIIITGATIPSNDDDWGLPIPQFPIMMFVGMSLIFFTVFYCIGTCQRARYPHTCEEKKGNSIWF